MCPTPPWWVQAVGPMLEMHLWRVLSAPVLAFLLDAASGMGRGWGILGWEGRQRTWCGL